MCQHVGGGKTGEAVHKYVIVNVSGRKTSGGVFKVCECQNLGAKNKSLLSRDISLVRQTSCLKSMYSVANGWTQTVKRLSEACLRANLLFSWQLELYGQRRGLLCDGPVAALRQEQYPGYHCVRVGF